MSDRSPRQLEFFSRGEPARRQALFENPPGDGVTQGSIAVRPEESARTISLDDAAIDQLAARLTQRLQPRSSVLFGALAAAYLAALEAKRKDVTDPDWHVRRLEPLLADTESTLTAGKIEDHFARLLTEGLSPVSINKLRSTGKLVIAHAKRHGQWNGPNAFSLVRRLKEPKRTYELLTLEELRRVERGFELPQWRRMFRVAVLTGMREGELYALEVGDLDFNVGTIRINKSHEKGQTKTGVERVIPMHPALESDFLAARREAQQRSGVLLFVNKDGGILSHHTKACKRLRVAMARAGVGLVDVAYTCRRKICQRKEIGATPVQIRICKCGWKMLAAPRVRDVRWYDLRHMCSTLHHEHGADHLCRALALGHSIEDITGRVYTHPSAETMRRELTRWTL